MWTRSRSSSARTLPSSPRMTLTGAKSPCTTDVVTGTGAIVRIESWTARTVRSSSSGRTLASRAAVSSAEAGRRPSTRSIASRTAWVGIARNATSSAPIDADRRRMRAGSSSQAAPMSPSTHGLVTQVEVSIPWVETGPARAMPAWLRESATAVQRAARAVASSPWNRRAAMTRPSASDSRHVDLASPHAAGADPMSSEPAAAATASRSGGFDVTSRRRRASRCRRSCACCPCSPWSRHPSMPSADPLVPCASVVPRGHVPDRPSARRSSPRTPGHRG